MLQKILDAKRAELREVERLAAGSDFEPRPFDLKAGPGLSLIAEIKFRSPSAGALSTHLSVPERARCYEAAGAQMISVLCDQRFFAGGYEHLAQARSACDLPLLCKEFIIDEKQLDAARSHGADAVLLIVRCLPQPQLEALVAASRQRNLEPLVEVFGPEEQQRALDAGASVIGVNSRDLDTLEMDPDGARRVVSTLPKDLTRLLLSGVACPADLEPIAACGADGALIGEVLMRQEDPTELLSALRRKAATLTAQ